MAPDIRRLNVAMCDTSTRPPQLRVAMRAALDADVQRTASVFCSDDFMVSMEMNVHAVPNTAPAKIRKATRRQKRNFLAGPPPYPVPSAEYLIDRETANILDGFATWAQYFLRASDDFVAHATKMAPYKNRPRAWSTWGRGAWIRRVDDYDLIVGITDNGWLIERQSQQFEPAIPGQVLTLMFVEAPILCPTPATAARLADACHPVPPSDQYLLFWMDAWT